MKITIRQLNSALSICQREHLESQTFRNEIKKLIQKMLLNKIQELDVLLSDKSAVRLWGRIKSLADINEYYLKLSKGHKELLRKALIHHKKKE